MFWPEPITEGVALKYRYILAIAAIGMVTGCGNSDTTDNTAKAAVPSASDAASADGAKVVAAPAKATPTPLRGPELSALLGTKDKEICRPFTMAGRELLYSASAISDGKGGYRASGPRDIPGLGRKIAPTVLQPAQNDGRYGVRYEFDGKWNGLQVVGMGYDFNPGSDLPESTTLYLQDDPAKVASVLGGLGFPVAEGGGAKVVHKNAGFGPGDYFGLVSIIEKRGGRTAYECREGPFDKGDY